MTIIVARNIETYSQISVNIIMPTSLGIAKIP